MPRLSTIHAEMEEPRPGSRLLTLARARALGLAASLLAAAGSAAQVPPETAVLAGQAVDAVTGAPVANTLIGLSQRARSGPNTTPVAPDTRLVVVMADGRPVELILPASRHVDLERARTVLHAHELRLATEAEMEQYFTDCEVGAIPALRHWKDVEVLMDRALNVEGDILFQAGTHADAVRLNFRDWYEMVNPQVASVSEPAEPAHA